MINILTFIFIKLHILFVQQYGEMVSHPFHFYPTHYHQFHQPRDSYLIKYYFPFKLNLLNCLNVDIQAYFDSICSHQSSNMTHIIVSFQKCSTLYDTCVTLSMYIVLFIALHLNFLVTLFDKFKFNFSLISTSTFLSLQ